MKPKNNLLLIVLVSAIALSKNANSQISFPNSEWQDMSEKELISLGFKIDSLSKAWRFIRDETPVTGMMVLVNGKSTIYFGDIKETSNIASIRKSVLAMLYGKYVANGTIDLSKTLKDLNVDDVYGLSELEKTATIENLLTAKSGVYHPASNTGDDTKFAPKRGTKKPGEYFLYNNWDFNVAGAIFEKLTGKSIYKAFEEDIAIPIGLQDYDLNEQKKTGNSQKSKYLAYHFNLSTRDMARLGLLMLNKGKWGDKEIIPENWSAKIALTKTKNTDMNPGYHKNGAFGYGYMWWVYDTNKVSSPNLEGAYMARGNYGQLIVVIPKLNMVIAVKTKKVYNRQTKPAHLIQFINILANSKLKE